MLYTLLQCVSNKRNLLKSVLIGCTLSIASTLSASAWAVEAPASAPPSLSKLRVPEPSNLSTVVADRAEAIALGKALFGTCALVVMAGKLAHRAILVLVQTLE